MKARITWSIDPPREAPKLFPGVMSDQKGGSWSVVALPSTDPDPDIFDVSFLTTPDMMTPGMSFDVFQGQLKTCHIEILESPRTWRILTHFQWDGVTLALTPEDRQLVGGEAPRTVYLGFEGAKTSSDSKALFFSQPAHLRETAVHLLLGWGAVPNATPPPFQFLSPGDRVEILPNTTGEKT